MQTALWELAADGWLLFDFRGSNVLARRILALPEHLITSRRWAYFVPRQGTPRKLVHRIEPDVLDGLPGEKTIYLRWQEFEDGLRRLVGSAGVVAMEYSPRNAIPYVSRVDAGTVELVRSFGTEVVSSGDLVQLFEACWDDDQWEMHLQAERHTTAAFDRAWRFIANSIRDHAQTDERAVQEEILRHFDEHGLTTHHPPIVAVGENSGNPHYETGSGRRTTIREGDLVLVDLWAKVDAPRAVYSDLTRMGFVGRSVPAEYAEVFAIVTEARDAAIACVREAFAGGRPLRGFEVDRAARAVIERHGYGEFFVHRTGHSIGQDVHGNGANMDDLETHDERRVLPRTCFSIEPGIYTERFGMRSEVNVFVDGGGTVHVTGGPPQTAIHPVLSGAS
ncbi:MAG: aminopeptidase P family protein [Planctomycetota bacterium]|nr:MAG: aminopeptidase P family protein [Planctomycetota bacterium]